LIIAFTAMTSVALAPVAHAQMTGGAGLGGAYSSSPPAITSIVCDTNCAGLDKVKTGSLLQISGLRLASVKKVTFTGRRGNRDDVTGTVVSRAEGLVTVRVPARAKSGKIRVFNGDGNKSKPSPKKVTVVRSSVTGKRLEARAEGRKTYIFDGLNKTALRYFVGAKGAAQVQIDLFRRGDPTRLAAWTETAVGAGSVRAVAWDGRVSGLQAADGAYEFRVRAIGNNTARSAQVSGSSATAGFSVLSYAFPIVGEHRFGTGAGSFGAGRSGYSHQGQDVFAKCGTPMVAARGGTVVKAGNESRAGNYVVIDADGDANDHVYMHLRRTPLVATGAHVVTRQPLGEVGQTGDASGCHLHFEIWTGGWLKGRAVDPRAALKSWDR
jgi:murein DD-endopeptidase MepM/ murein hydrolase activator NlpD